MSNTGVYFAPKHGSDSHGSGVLGFAGNLVHDVGDAAKGLPMGLLQLAEHPIRTTKNMAKTTWHDWSPLFHGHVGEFAHNVYAHPLAPMLDVATVFTGGASIAARMGVRLGETGAISADSALYRFSHMPTEVKLTKANRLSKKGKIKESYRDYTYHLPRNPIYNKAAREAIAFADKHPAIPSWFSSNSLYKHAEHRDWSMSGLAYQAGLAGIMKAGQLLSKSTPEELWRVERQLHAAAYKDLRANSLSMTVAEFKAKYGGKVPKGYAVVNPRLRTNQHGLKLFNKAPADHKVLGGRWEQLGDHFTLDKKAPWTEGVWKDKNKVEYIQFAHKGVVRKNMVEGKRATHFLHTLYNYPTAIWKYSVVGLSPRTVVDNAVGNWVMYALRQGGEHGIRGFVDAVHYTKGEAVARRMLRETGNLPKGYGGSYLNRYFKGELGNTFGSSILGHVQTGATGAGSTLSKMYRFSMYPVVHRYADVPVRAASISAYLRGDSAVQALMRKGMSFEDAANAALKKDTGLRERAVIHARTVAGNYATMTKAESVVRDFMPFYLWNKHITMHALNLLRDKPGRVAVTAALGQEGANKTRDKLGDIPGFMLSEIPFGKPGKDGRTSMFETSGLNPYSTVSELAGGLAALTTGHTEEKPGDLLLGMTNPVIKGIVEHTMGATGTGSPARGHGGVIPSMLTDTANSMKPVQLIRMLAGMDGQSKTAAGNSKLYKADLETLMSSILGAPIRHADIRHALELQKKIEAQSRPKKRKKRNTGVYFAP